jgi:Trypsin-like peptidase domain
MVLSTDGYVITSTSLVENVGKITVTLSDGKQMTAQIIGRDPRTAIALLKTSGATGLTAIHFGDAHLMRRGSSIFSIGNTYGLQNSLSSGVIAAIRRSGGALPHVVFQTDMVVQPGSAGAPLFNMKGEVVGMFTSNYSNAGKRAGIGLAVTSSVMKDVVEKLQKSGAIDRGWLGVQVQSDGRGGRRLDREGQQVVRGPDRRRRSSRGRGSCGRRRHRHAQRQGRTRCRRLRLGCRQPALELAGDAGHCAQRRAQGRRGDAGAHAGFGNRGVEHGRPDADR